MQVLYYLTPGTPSWYSVPLYHSYNLPSGKPQLLELKPHTRYLCIVYRRSQICIYSSPHSLLHTRSNIDTHPSRYSHIGVGGQIPLPLSHTFPRIHKDSLLQKWSYIYPANHRQSSKTPTLLYTLSNAFQYGEVGSIMQLVLFLVVPYPGMAPSYSQAIYPLSLPCLARSFHPRTKVYSRILYFNWQRRVGQGVIVFPRL